MVKAEHSRIPTGFNNSAQGWSALRPTLGGEAETYLSYPERQRREGFLGGFLQVFLQPLFLLSRGVEKLRLLSGGFVFEVGSVTGFLGTGSLVVVADG